MTEIKLTLDDPGMAARQLRHAANHWNDGAPKPNPVGDLLLAVADSIEEQVEPAIEEPTEFGSIVRAGVDGLSDRVLWARGGGHYWFSETIRRADFEDLYQPEVLRVGIGEPAAEQQAAAKYETTVALGEAYSRGYHEGVESNKTSYIKGRDDFSEAMRNAFSALRAKALCAERKDAYDKALALVAALLGES